MKLTYNAVTFPFQKTEGADEQMEYSDDGMDLLRVRRTYTVVATITAASFPAGVAKAGDTYAMAIKRLECALKVPRCELQIEFGEGTILYHPPANDAKGGPFPEVLSITNWTGSGQDAFTLRFRVTCYTSGCCDTTGSNTGGGSQESASQLVQWLSNRWTESVDISGEDFRTTRNRNGKLVIRPGKLSPDAFRGLVTPPVPKGFLRTRAHYTLQSDNLALLYSFSDEEQYMMPPPGVVKASGTCRISADRGIFRTVEISLRLTGDVQQSKTHLLEVGSTIVLQKLQEQGAPVDAKGALVALSGSISEQLYRNEIEISMRAMLAPKKTTSALSKKVQAIGTGLARGASFLVNPFLGLYNAYKTYNEFQAANSAPSLGGVGGAIAGIGDSLKAGEAPPAGDKKLPDGVVPNLKNFGKAPWGSDSGVVPDFGLRSTAGLSLLAAALRDPCLYEAVVAPGAGGVEEDIVNDDFVGPPAPDDFVGPPAPAPESEFQLTPPAPNTYFWPLFKNQPAAVAPNGDAGLPSGTSAPPAASPTFEVVDDVGEFGSQVSAEYSSSLYTDYRIFQRVIDNQSMVALTEQRAGGLTHFIPVAAPTKTLEIQWTCERVGAPPAVLPTASDDDNLVYLRGEYDPGTGDTDESGTLMFRASGRYFYGYKNPALAAPGLALPPWLNEQLGGSDAPALTTAQAVNPDSDPTADAFTLELDEWVADEEQPASV